jgi:putative ATP-dependent endonuclease of the OLD family
VFIDGIDIENYRCIQDGGVGFGNVTTFLGRNGVGKSTVLYALESFYNLAVQHTDLDYYNHEANRTIRIRVTYAGLRDDELREFAAYVHDGKLTVSKVINAGGARYYGTTAQIPRFADLRRIPGARDKRVALKAMLDQGEFPDFGELPTRGEDVDRAMEAYERAHPALLQPIEGESQFFGPKNVGGGKLDKFTKFVLVPAVRDAASETEKRGAIMQLLDLIVTRSISTRADFLEFKQEFEDRAKSLYGKDNVPELAELGRLVTERLSRYSPGAELIIDFAELQPPAIPLPDAVVTISEDNFKVPVRYSGHGLQRALILALLEQLSMTRPPVANTDGVAPSPDTQVERQPDLILAIEEPELYLHPARSRYLAGILRGLAETGHDGPGIQVVTVTHSPYFVDVEHFDEIRMCRKVPAAHHAQPGVTSFSHFTKLQAAQRLATLNRRRPEEFTASTFVARAAPVLNSIVNEGLFADVVVVVEGESDVAALWAMQIQMNRRWDELGIVVVPVSGKSKIDRAVVAFQGFGIPTYFMFDGDKTRGTDAITNRLLLRLGNGEETDFPTTTFTARYAVFEHDIETYFREAAGKLFEPLRNECAARCGHDRPSTALKNSEVMQAFLLACHANGLEFPFLVQVVEQVTEMALQLRPAAARAGTAVDEDHRMLYEPAVAASRMRRRVVLEP